MMFQSTPAIAGGRSPMCGRWLRQAILFQSTPAIAGGRSAHHVARKDRNALVSIHARHCWRAKLLCRGCPPQHRAVSIHARHCWRAKLRKAIDNDPLWWFQSTPAIAGGRSRCLIRSWPMTACFNPRPPLLAGEAQLQRARVAAAVVSIHARHCWRAKLCQGDGLAGRVLFQSTPAIAGGRSAGDPRWPP